jgi:membrane protease YdiL (CAAX protease family)
MGRSSTGLFILLAFATSWSYWGWMILTGRMVGPDSHATHLPGLAGPAIAALMVTSGAPDRLRPLLRSAVTIPRRGGLAALAILAPLVIAALVLAIRPPGELSDLFAYPGVPRDWSPLAVVAVALLLNGLGEEMGWRGFLFPQLRRRFAPIPATFIVAAIWAVWHAPLFVVNLNMAAMLGIGLVGWLIGLTLGAFVLGYLYEFTGGSVLAVALWHTSYNFAVATEAMQGLPAAVVSTAVMIAGVAVFMTWWRKGR